MLAFVVGGQEFELHFELVPAMRASTGCMEVVRSCCSSEKRGAIDKAFVDMNDSGILESHGLFDSA